MAIEESLFFIDKGSLKTCNVPCESEGTYAPAWVDEDDLQTKVDLSKSSKLKSLKQDISEQCIDGTEYSKRLRAQHEALYPKPKWATASEPTEMEALLGRPFELMAEAEKLQLLPDVIELQRLSDANVAESCKKPIVSSQFHPNSPIALISSSGDSSARFFILDDKLNEKLHEVAFPGLKAPSVSFSPDGRYVLATGKSRNIYIYDVLENRVEIINNVPDKNEIDWNSFLFSPCGKFLAFAGNEGRISIFSWTSKRWAFTLKMNGNARCMAFHPNGGILITAGDEHLVYFWDLKTFTCFLKFPVEAGNVITSIGISPNSQHICFGSNLGVVDLYEMSTILDNNAVTLKKPWKTLMNLTTEIQITKFHPSSQLLAIATNASFNGLRLVHIPSGRVYSNWPNSQIPIGNVKSLDFNHDGSMMMIGTGYGKVKLFALKHFRK